MTVPFGCPFIDDETDKYDCAVTVELSTPGVDESNGGCNPELKPTKCRDKVQQPNWFKTKTFDIQLQDTSAYILNTKVFIVQLQILVFHKIWNKYPLPEIKANIRLYIRYMCRERSFNLLGGGRDEFVLKKNHEGNCEHSFPFVARTKCILCKLFISTKTEIGAS